MALGERIAQIRGDKGMTQIFVARQLKKTPQWLSNIEKGRREIGARELHQIAEVLGVNVGIFFEGKLNETLNPTGTEGGD